MHYKFITNRKDLNYAQLPPRSHLINLLKTKTSEFDLELDYRAIANLEILEIYRILSLEDVNTIVKELIVFIFKQLCSKDFRQPGFTIFEYAFCYEGEDYGD